MLKLDSVNTAYGLIEALKDITLDVKKGEIVFLIGSNGAGKSTALMTISGILKPKTGRIFFENTEITNKPPHSIVSMGISHVPEGRRIFPRLTVKGNLEMGSFIRGKRQGPKGIKDRLERVFSLFPVLKERCNQMGGTLSGGEQQMLAIGRALMSNPKMLLLDEPSLGLAPIIASRIFRIIKEIRNEGVTVLLVEQNAHAALDLSDRGYVLENGRITIHGSRDELLKNEKIKAAYLGD